MSTILNHNKYHIKGGTILSDDKHIGKALIEKIEKIRNSKVIVYFTGDRHPFGARIAEDAVRPLYDHLLNLEFKERNMR